MENYHGREQSFIKHLFLTQYLKSLSFKIFQGRSRVFNFIDAFAGPWNTSASDYSDASFEQSLRTLASVREAIDPEFNLGLQIRLCLCEKRPNAIQALERYGQDRQGFAIRVFPGNFEDNLDEIKRFCSNGFTFTFIDPTGWNIDSEPVFRFLRELKGEFLLNFMSEDINRHAGYHGVSQSFGRFLADPGWRDAFEALPSEWSNGKRIRCLLIKNIKNAGATRFMPGFDIKRPTQERTKMTLLLGTNVPDGVRVFRDVQEKVEQEEIRVRDEIRRRGQISLFSDEQLIAIRQGREGVGCSDHREHAEQEVKDLLMTLPDRQAKYADIEPSILEQIPLKATHLKEVLKSLKNNREITYELPGNARVPKPGTVITLSPIR